MKASDEFSAIEALEEQAAGWLCEKEEGFAPGRAREFALWCEADPRHAAAVERVGRTLALLAEMPAVRAPLEARVGPVVAMSHARPAARITRFPFPVWTAGLAAALVVGATTWWLGLGARDAGERYATPAAVQQRVALRDGSVVDLNTNSNVEVEFTKRERRVVLGAGEAHFQVSPDASRPFIVTAGGVSVRAVGTAFNVRIAADAIDVLVVEGKVEVVRKMEAAPEVPAARPMLVAGDRMQVSRADPAAEPQFEKVTPATIRASLAWQERVTSFTDVPLREIVAQFNRRNPATRLEIADAELGARKVGGVIALDQVEAFVRLLEQDGDVIAERRPTGEIVLRRAR
jgi:transmembrane sensor